MNYWYISVVSSSSSLVEFESLYNTPLRISLLMNMSGRMLLRSGGMFFRLIIATIATLIRCGIVRLIPTAEPPSRGYNAPILVGEVVE